MKANKLLDGKLVKMQATKGKSGQSLQGISVRTSVAHDYVHLNASDGVRICNETYGSYGNKKKAKSAEQ